MEKTSLNYHLNRWLSIIKDSKSNNTFMTSVNAGKSFMRAIGSIPLSTLTEDHYSQFLTYLKRYDARTEQLYAGLIYGFFEYLEAKEIHRINIPKLKYTRKSEQRRPGRRLRKFDRPSIEHLKSYVIGYRIPIKKLSRTETLIMARSKAMVVLALESGLRVSEIVKLRLADLDFADLSGTVIGKRDKERMFPFTENTRAAIRFYIRMRSQLEPQRGHGLPPDQFPIFVSHSKRGYTKLAPMDTDTARLDLQRMIRLALVKMKYPITPHLLRHFAGNDFYRQTGDIEQARILLGQESVETTKQYMHTEQEDLKKTYRKIYGRKDK